MHRTEWFDESSLTSQGKQMEKVCQDNNSSIFLVTGLGSQKGELGNHPDRMKGLRAGSLPTNTPACIWSP
jgi:hypothetical protein